MISGLYSIPTDSHRRIGEPCRMNECETSLPGKDGAARERIVGQGIFNGNNMLHVGPVSMQIHIPMINKKVGQIISINGDTVQVMDSESFETIDIAMIDDVVKGKLENGQNVEYWVVMEHTKIMSIKNS